MQLNPHPRHLGPAQPHSGLAILDPDLVWLGFFISQNKYFSKTFSADCHTVDSPVPGVIRTDGHGNQSSAQCGILFYFFPCSVANSPALLRFPFLSPSLLSPVSRCLAAHLCLRFRERLVSGYGVGLHAWVSFSHPPFSGSKPRAELTLDSPSAASLTVTCLFRRGLLDASLPLCVAPYCLCPRLSVCSPYEFPPPLSSFLCSPPSCRP